MNFTLPILLESVSFEDDYEGDFVTRRSIIWTLSFVMKLNFYGPISKQGVIKRVVATAFKDSSLSQTQQIITTTADPVAANVTDNYTYISNFEDF